MQDGDWTSRRKKLGDTEWMRKGFKKEADIRIKLNFRNLTCWRRDQRKTRTQKPTVWKCDVWSGFTSRGGEEWWNGDRKSESKRTFRTSSFSVPSCYTDLTGSQILKSGLRHKKPVSSHLRYGTVYDWIMKIIHIVCKQSITHILIKSQYLLYAIQNEIQ